MAYHGAFPVPDTNLWSFAEAALQGAGDPAHEWRERGIKAVHVRRRLTPEELQHTGPAVDVRATPDGHARWYRALGGLPPAVARALSRDPEILPIAASKRT